jgi:hypothetical protein
MRAFVRGFVRYVESKQHWDLAQVIDTGVYTANRMMRMVGSFKSNDPTRVPFVALGDNPDGEISAFLLQCDAPLSIARIAGGHTDDYSDNLAAPTTQHVCAQESARAHSIIDWGDLPAGVHASITETARAICNRATFGSLRTLNSDHKNRRIFSVYCYINKCAYECPACNRQHTGNNFVIKYHEERDQVGLHPATIM